MTELNSVAAAYIAVWNETDPEKRQELLAEGWTERATYSDPMMAASGRDQIAALIEEVQTRFPGFRFALQGAVDGFGENLRFCWSLGPAEEPEMIRGTDFARIEDGRLKSVTGFLDKVPDAA
jgi:hypothetical protein